MATQPPPSLSLFLMLLFVTATRAHLLFTPVVRHVIVTENFPSNFSSKKATLFSRAFNVTMFCHMQLFTLNIKLKLVNCVNNVCLFPPNNSCYRLFTYRANEIDFDAAFEFSLEQNRMFTTFKFNGKLTLFRSTCTWIQMKGLQDRWTDLNANILLCAISKKKKCA